MFSTTTTTSTTTTNLQNHVLLPIKSEFMDEF